MLRCPPIFTKLHGGPWFSLHARTHGRFVITNMKMNNFLYEMIQYFSYFYMMIIHAPKIHGKLSKDVIIYVEFRHCSLQLATIGTTNR